MVSFRNGILKIQFDKKNDRNFYQLLFDICIYFGTIFYFLERTSLHYFGVGFFLVGTALVGFKRVIDFRFNNIAHTAWYLLFIAFAELSSLWAYAPLTSALRYIRFMLLIVVICFGVTQYTTSVADTERLVEVYAAAAFTIALIEFIGTPVEDWMAGYFGRAIGGGNTNTFGYILLFGAIIAFYKGYVKGKRWWYLPMIIMLAGCVLSSSRKAALMSVFGILFIMFFSFNRRNHFLHLAIAAVVVVSAYLIVMTNESLYEVLGNRLESLFSFMNDGTGGDGSLYKRDFYILYAHELFARSPILGQGFANFADLLYHEVGGGYIYAHNNYWEILADLGVVGFVIYYWFYAYIGLKLTGSFFKKKLSEIQTLAIVMFLAQLFLEWGVVSMYNLHNQFIIALIFACTFTDKYSDQKKYYYSDKSDGGE